MSSGSNPRRTGQRDRAQGDVVQTSPSNKRLANIPRQAVEKACKSLRRLIFKDDDDDEILGALEHVWIGVKGALEQDPKLKERLASEEEFRDNVTMKGEKSFIDSLRAMAANSDTQGSKAWHKLFEDGTSFSLDPSILIEFSV
jgi:hypothetical protein